MTSPLAVAVGAGLAVFGIAGIVAARRIVAERGEVGVTAYDDTPVDEETEIKIARLFGAVFLVVGAAVAAYGLDLF